MGRNPPTTRHDLAVRSWMVSRSMSPANAPVSPTTVSNLLKTMAITDFSIFEVADVVASDSGLTARVLAVSNSASFGLARQVSDVHQAVSLVGTNLVRTLAIAGSTSLLDSERGLPGVRAHAIEVACAARFLASISGLSKPDAFAAGLLHDLGELLLWQRDPEVYAEAHSGWTDAAEQLRAERGMFGTDHTLVAREQLAEWGLPGALIDAVGDHHLPDLTFPNLSTLLVAAEELTDPNCAGSRRLEVLGVVPEKLGALREELTRQVEDLDQLLRAA